MRIERSLGHVLLILMSFGGSFRIANGQTLKEVKNVLS